MRPLQLFDPDSSTYTYVLFDVATREARCFRPHDIALRDGVCYVGETDNPERTGYLWEVPL